MWNMGSDAADKVDIHFCRVANVYRIKISLVASYASLLLVLLTGSSRPDNDSLKCSDTIHLLIFHFERLLTTERYTQ